MLNDCSVFCDVFVLIGRCFELKRRLSRTLSHAIKVAIEMNSDCTANSPMGGYCAKLARSARVIDFRAGECLLSVGFQIER
jgi:hypothetical protein